MPSYGQTVTLQYTAWNTATNTPQTGDSANHTLHWIKDGTEDTGTLPTGSEIDSTNCPGVYKASITATQAQCQVGTLCGKSSTSNVVLLPFTVTFENLPTAATSTSSGLPVLATPANLLATDSSGRVILQPTQAGVTIPTVTSVTNAVTLPANPPSGFLVNASYGTGPSWYTTPPTASAIAAVILATPANLLATDSSGRVLLQPTQTGVTIPTVTTVTTATNLTNLPSIPANWLTSSGIAASAITAIQSGLATPTNITAGTITTVGTTTNLTNLPSIPANWLTSSGIAASAITAIQSGLATPTNITAGTITTVGTTTNLTNLPSIPANWLTSSGIASAALNGKGDWLLSSGYTAPPTVGQIATAVWTDTTSSDFTTTSSPGKILVGQLGGTFTTATSSVFLAAALVNAPTGGSAPTVAQIATAVWQDLTASSDFTTSNSIGALLKTYSAAPSASTIAAAILATPANLLATDSSGHALISLTQNLAAFGSALTASTADTSITVNQALHGAMASVAGKQTTSGTAYTTETSAGTTIRVFALDQNPNPNNRS